MKNLGMDQIGYALEDNGNQTNNPVLLNGRSPDVILVFGTRGSGKSVSAMVLAEERSTNGTHQACIVIDPLGMAGGPAPTMPRTGEGPHIARWLVGTNAPPFPSFILNLWSLTTDEVCRLLGAETPQQLGFVSLLWSTLKKHNPSNLFMSPGDLLKSVRDFGTQSGPSTVSENTLAGIERRIIQVSEYGILADSPNDATDLLDLVESGRISVLDFGQSHLPRRIEQLLVGVLADRLLETRLHAVNVGDNNRIPNVTLFIDEAQLFAPESRQTAASDSIIRYVKCGRRAGCGIVLATQQPRSINSQVTSQCDTVIAHRLGNTDDIRDLLQIVPLHCTRTQLSRCSKALEHLAPGEAILFGGTSSEPTNIQMRQRITTHNGKTCMAALRNAPSEMLFPQQTSASDTNRPPILIKGGEYEQRRPSINHHSNPSHDSDHPKFSLGVLQKAPSAPAPTTTEDRHTEDPEMGTTKSAGMEKRDRPDARDHQTNETGERIMKISTIAAALIIVIGILLGINSADRLHKAISRGKTLAKATYKESNFAAQAEANPRNENASNNSDVSATLKESRKTIEDWDQSPSSPVIDAQALAATESSNTVTSERVDWFSKMDGEIDRTISMLSGKKK